MARLILLFVSLMLPIVAGSTTGDDDGILDTLKSKIRLVQHLALNPVIIKAVKGEVVPPGIPPQLQPATVSEAATDNADDMGGIPPTVSVTEETEMPAPEMDHELVLREFVDRSTAFKQIFISNAKGDSIAAYPESEELISEADRRKTQRDAGGKIFIGPMQMDEKTRTISTYIAAPIHEREREIGTLLVVVQLGGNQRL